MEKIDVEFLSANLFRKRYRNDLLLFYRDIGFANCCLMIADDVWDRTLKAIYPVIGGIAIGAIVERGLAELIKFQWKATAAERGADGQAAEQSGSGGAVSLAPRLSHSAQDR